MVTGEMKSASRLFAIINTAKLPPEPVDSAEPTRIGDSAPKGTPLDIDAMLREADNVPTGLAASRDIDARASDLLLAMLGMAAEENDELLLVNKIRSGLDAGVVERLRAAGVPATTIYEVIAPKRTVMRRKQERDRLTTAESDGAYRLAYLLSLASVVLASREAAVAWLSRPKDALRGLTPWEATTTSLGFERAGYLLWQLEAGNSA